ncbi:putative S-adenosylmethionine-dependent methyltransferase At5g37990 [Senna tora]|uniref:Putative S-adenosylmethionine-dependent methyltransferase At5g37990 n=1 Tax=Senna tora TaxID=362788 RepID=A0A834TSP5_9FABA|nr:putative S-adenosylmethionine-dependent methyltransferase At5g37990 [Senna tora]
MENQSFAMKGGEGPHSYLQNSSLQRNAIEAQKKLIEEAIANNFNPIITHTQNPTNLICIADFGCSTGPNTFIAIQTIIQAIQSHYVPNITVTNRDNMNLDSRFHKLNPYDETLEFLVFFNDQVPKEIMDRSSAWNKGMIHCTNTPMEVREAYEAQFKEDFESFLDARAQEVIGNGLMALQLATTPDMIVESSDIDPNIVFELLGSSLMDMAKVGIISEDKVDSFNLPIIYPPIKGVKEIVERNEFFSIETMEALNFEDFYAFPNPNIFVSIYRAVVEDLIEKHFGGAIVDDLFDRFTQKVVEFPEILNPNNFKMVLLFVLLKRKIDTIEAEGAYGRGVEVFVVVEVSNRSCRRRRTSSWDWISAERGSTVGICRFHRKGNEEDEAEQLSPTAPPTTTAVLWLNSP